MNDKVGLGDGATESLAFLAQPIVFKEFNNHPAPPMTPHIA
jgi:hypothetical protein